MRWKWIISTIWLPILKCWFLSDNLTDCTNNKPLYLCLFVSASSNSLLPILFRVKNNQILGTDQAKSQIQSWNQICTLVFQDPYLQKSCWLMFVLSYSRIHTSISADSRHQRPRKGWPLNTLGELWNILGEIGRSLDFGTEHDEISCHLSAPKQSSESFLIIRLAPIFPRAGRYLIRFKCYGFRFQSQQTKLGKSSFERYFFMARI